jgi:hypothetical protein
MTSYPPRRFPLSKSVSGKFKADGTLQVQLITDTFEAWDINLTGVFTDDPSTAVIIPQADLYQDLVSPVQWRGGTYSGNRDQSTALIHLDRSESLICVWQGGTAGRTGTLAVSGFIWR